MTIILRSNADYVCCDVISFVIYFIYVVHCYQSKGLMTTFSPDTPSLFPSKAASTAARPPGTTSGRLGSNRPRAM